MRRLQQAEKASNDSSVSRWDDIENPLQRAKSNVSRVLGISTDPAILSPPLETRCGALRLVRPRAAG